MRPLSWFIEQAEVLIERDLDLRAMQAAMDRMANIEYELPEGLRDLQWMRTVPSTAPYDALRGATRALASLDERLKIHPISVKKALRAGTLTSASEARAKANEWETVLKWQMDGSAARKPVFRSDVILSAAKYDECCGLVMHLPTQGEALKKLGGGKGKHWEAARRYGDFLVMLKNPQTVHAKYSPYMLEQVLNVECWGGQDLLDFWGDRASGLDPDTDYVVFDFHILEERCVWVLEGDSESVLTGQEDAKSKVAVIFHEEHTYPFMPWVCLVGGTDLDTRQVYKRQPLLAPVYHAELWITANIVLSVSQSKVIATAAAPTGKISGPNPEQGVQYNYDEPGADVLEKPGHVYSPLPDRQMDPKLIQAGDRLESAIATSTLARVLVTAEAQSGEAFASYNLRIQTALGALAPYKKLAERWFTAVYRTMLEWAHYTKTDISGYGTKRSNYGDEFCIKFEHIDPRALYMDVELTPDVPLDRIQKTNAAQMQHALGRPLVAVLEELGSTDPEGEMRQRRNEDRINAIHAGHLQRLQAETSGQMEQEIMAMAQQIAAQQQEQAQLEAPQPEGGDPFAALMGGGDGASLSGNGMAPPMGGMPPAMADPGLTRERVNGVSAMGEDLA